MVDLKEAEERVILVGVALYDIEEMEHSLEELKELVTTAGAVSLEGKAGRAEGENRGTRSYWHCL